MACKLVEVSRNNERLKVEINLLDKILYDAGFHEDPVRRVRELMDEKLHEHEETEQWLYEAKQE